MQVVKTNGEVGADGRLRLDDLGARDLGLAGRAAAFGSEPNSSAALSHRRAMNRPGFRFYDPLSGCR
jgi:hypothetical protein